MSLLSWAEAKCPCQQAEGCRHRFADDIADDFEHHRGDTELRVIERTRLIGKFKSMTPLLSAKSATAKRTGKDAGAPSTGSLKVN